MLYFVPGPVPEKDYLIPIGQADVKRRGTDVTVVTWSQDGGRGPEGGRADRRGGHWTWKSSICAPLVPMDKQTVIDSRFARPVAWWYCMRPTRTGGFAGEVAAVVMEEALDSLKAPLRRVTGPDIPVPASPPLERFYIPGEEDLISAVKEIVS